MKVEMPLETNLLKAIYWRKAITNNGGLCSSLLLLSSLILRINSVLHSGYILAQPLEASLE
jgi:hypothetical protein